MVRKVYKYKLDSGVTRITLPFGAVPLHVAIQHDEIQLWALVERDERGREDRFFQVVGTGHAFDDASAKYVGTVLTTDGAYVFHVFEVKRR